MKTVKGILEEKGTIVHTIEPEHTVLDALREMADRNIGALAVVDGGRLIGLVTERDYARKVILRGKFSKDTRVREIMTERVICVGQTQEVDACMALMTEHRVRHLPVLENGDLCGIISIGDVVRAIIEHQQFTIEQLEHYITGRT
jgi:CBS domain-containing protein